jgi:hypothetical protein
LSFSAKGFLAQCCSGVLPVGDLNDGIGDAVDVAGVVCTTCTELAACRKAEEIMDQLGRFTFSPIAFGFLRIGHASVWIGQWIERSDRALIEGALDISEALRPGREWPMVEVIGVIVGIVEEGFGSGVEDVEGVVDACDDGALTGADVHLAALTVQKGFMGLGVAVPVVSATSWACLS